MNLDSTISATFLVCVEVPEHLWSHFWASKEFNDEWEHMSRESINSNVYDASTCVWAEFETRGAAERFVEEWEEYCDELQEKYDALPDGEKSK